MQVIASLDINEMEEGEIGGLPDLYDLILICTLEIVCISKHLRSCNIINLFFKIH